MSDDRRDPIAEPTPGLPTPDMHTEETTPMTSDPTSLDPTSTESAGTGTAPMARHRIDIVAFLFGLFFLAVTALAFAVQGRLLIGDDPRAGAWMAGGVLITAGVLAVIGVLTTGLRRSST